MRMKMEFYQITFYGARNISQSKLGKVIYIPDICKTDDTLKLSCPSPFRNMVNFVMKKLVKNSAAFKKLGDSFEDFNIEFKEEIISRWLFSSIYD